MSLEALAQTAARQAEKWAGWAIVVAGAAAIGGIAWHWSKPSTAQGRVGSVAEHYWLPSLKGKRLALPETDSQGYPIPRTDLVMVALGVGCCSSGPPAIDGLIRACSVRPLLIAVPTALQDVPPSWLGRPSEVLVLCDPNGAHVPAEMLNAAPQAALLDATGTILSVPRSGQTLEQFLSNPEATDAPR